MAQLGAEYPSPDELFRFLDRHRVGAGYIRTVAEMIKAKYPKSWPGMRAKFGALYKDELKREAKM
jgi:hypothetical protein